MRSWTVSEAVFGKPYSCSELCCLHFDVKGKMETVSVHGHSYFLAIVHEHSKCPTVTPLWLGGASDALLAYITKFVRKSGHLLRAVNTDGGKEFVGSLKLLGEQGVDVPTTTSYTPKSNGLAERTHSTILSLARRCLKEVNIPL